MPDYLLEDSYNVRLLEHYIYIYIYTHTQDNRFSQLLPVRIIYLN